jgi:hypothetical protein
MAHLYKEKRKCECGFSTFNRGNWSQHTRLCKTIIKKKDSELFEQIKKQLEAKDQQLAVKDEQMKAMKEDMKEQLAAKDEQIKELLEVAKKQKTVNNNNNHNSNNTTNNNRFMVENHVNVFGKENTDHITPKQIQQLLSDPVNAVPHFITLKYRRAPGGVNKNIRVPNQKRAIYQVVVAGEGENKEWEHKSKAEVLEQLYDDNSEHLEVEADEDTRHGSIFLNFQDKVKASAGGEDGGRRYKEQLDKIHSVVMNM